VADRNVRAPSCGGFAEGLRQRYAFGKHADAHSLCGTRRASPARVGAVISVCENVAAPCDRPPPLEPGSDRQAAHYYRSQHSRAIQREQQWKQRALAAEKIIAQLVVWVGWCVQQIEALKGQLAWLKKQPFGRKSEATPAEGVAGCSAGGTAASGVDGSAAAPTPGPAPVAGGAVAPLPGRPGAAARQPRPQRATALGFARRDHRAHAQPRRAHLCAVREDWTGNGSDGAE
jgi:hypothetical protein